AQAINDNGVIVAWAGSYGFIHSVLLTPVQGVGTSIQVANPSGQAGQSVSLSAVLRRTDTNAVLPSRALNFYVNNTYVGTATTDSTGTAHTNYTLPANLNAGTQLTIIVVRLSNSQFNGSIGFGTLTVTP